jgi:molybdenum cofactor synthesis domain-containing protein
MIELNKAIKIVGRETYVLRAEKCLLADSSGRILNEDIIADSDLPPFDRSQMDGFAVIAADTRDAPVRLEIVGESAAGRGWHKLMKPGEAVSIMTGAPVPKGADAVQKIELTRIPNAGNGAVVEIVEPVQRGTAIVRKGAEVKKGRVVLTKGTAVTENNIAVLAAFGYANVRVAKRPRVAILGTGSEIVAVGNRPGRDQIRNSNSVMLSVLCQKFGGETTILPIAKDDISNLKFHISNAVKHVDILVITGGVSVGKYDHTKAALTELGAKIFFDKVRLKPGKPAVFAQLGKSLVFGLPGNPVSAAVTFHLFVRTALLTMQAATCTGPRKGFAVLAEDVRATRGRDTYLPARLETDRSGQLLANPLKWQGSSDFIGFSLAESLIVLAGGEELRRGEVAAIVHL